MNRVQHRSSLAALAIVIAAAVAACSSLDDRKVTRGPDAPAGGDGSGNTGNSGTGGDEPSVGGADSRGGESPMNPFGGDTFTGGAPPVVDGPPEVLEVAPGVDAEDVNPNAAVSLLFSEGLDAATVTADNIQIMDGDQAVPGAFSYEGVVSTFEPASRLSLLATYDVNVSTGVTDAGGQALKGAFASKFTVRDGVWGRQGSVHADPMTVGSHASATDAQGNVLIVYTRDVAAPTGGTLSSVFARWARLNSATLTEEVPLEDNGLPCGAPKVALDADGNAVAIWEADAGTQAYLRARRFVEGAWERSPQNVAQDGASATMTNADSTAVAIGSGQVVVAWTRYFYQGSGNYVLNYTSTPLKGAWPALPSSPVSVANSEALTRLQASVDAKGTALVTFAWQTTGAYRGIYFARRAVGTDWEYPTKIPTSNVPSNPGGPLLASDGEGAMAVWLDYLNYEYHLMASRYTKAKQFAAPIEIGDPKVLGNAKLMTPGGLAVNGASYWVTWTQALGNSKNVYVKRFDIASGVWDLEPTLVSDGVAQAEASAIGVDAHGNAVVTYDQSAANNYLLIMGSRYVASSGRWSDPTPLTEAKTYYDTPALSVARNGVAALFFSSTKSEGRPGSEDTSGNFRIFK